MNCCDSFLILMIADASTGQDAPQSIPGNFESSCQPSHEKPNLGSTCPPVDMRLIKYKGKNIALISSEPVPRLGKYRPLNRTEKHILEHRVIRDNNVGAASVNLVPS